MTFYPLYDLSLVRPAAYNPRLIDEAAKEKLRESLRELGLIKPIIVAANQTLIAGHQRTMTMRSIGITHAPAYLLGDVSETDEIRFNQLHNGSDIEFGNGVLRVPPQPNANCFVEIPYKALQGNPVTDNAPKKTEISRLLIKHGPWGSMVITQSGEVLISKLYAICCKLLGMPIMAYVVRDDQRETVLKYFSLQYGKFSYDHLPKTTWGQSLAQMYRLREGTTDRGKAIKSLRSRTYENVAMPLLKRLRVENPKLRILDFGAGQMDYVKSLKARGFNIRGVEFYFRSGVHINVSQVNRDIDGLCADIRRNGLFDMVICDSVVNSVDSVQAEEDVLICLSAFCKAGGIVVYSGRARYPEERKEEHALHHTSDHRNVNFFDDHGFSAIYSQGVWRYQKFHYLHEIYSMTEKYFGTRHTDYDQDEKAHEAREEIKHTSWAVTVYRDKEHGQAKCEASLAREFDLPLPEGKRYGRSQDIVEAWREALKHGQ